MDIERDTQALPRHPVRLVSERTGLSPHVLRVWERRYGAVHPLRSAGGQRLYSDADVERLRLLHGAAQGGRNIGQLVSLADEELERLIAGDRGAVASPDVQPGPDRARDERALDLRRGAMAAVAYLDAGELDAILRRAASVLGTAEFTDGVIVPLLGDIGLCWRRGELSPAHEHLASAVVRRVLDGVRDACRPPRGAPTLIVATPPGQVHEMGALLVAATGAACGWRVMYLGTDLPAIDIARAADLTGARAIGLSVVYPEGDARTSAALAALVELMPAGCILALGGAAAGAYHARLPRRPGIQLFTSLAGVRGLLSQLEDSPDATAD